MELKDEFVTSLLPGLVKAEILMEDLDMQVKLAYAMADAMIRHKMKYDAPSNTPDPTADISTCPKCGAGPLIYLPAGSLDSPGGKIAVCPDPKCHKQYYKSVPLG